MLGIDRFLISSPSGKTTRYGLLTNHATLAGSGKPVAVELLQRGIIIQKLFSPEHGVFSQAEDGAAQQNQTDKLTGLPVVSLYGENLTPQEEDLKSIDAVLVDLPNIGCRFYTYWWTITHMMEACARFQKPIIILDRPNWRGANSVTEGPLLDEVNCSSFLGRWSMPLSFSYTLGQLARWFVRQKSIRLNLEVVPYDEDDFPHFVPPSPAINEIQTTYIYPCTGLFEGVNVSVGRGTTFPFRVIGAPRIDSLKFLDYFNTLKLDGVIAHPYAFKPEWSVYEKQFCSGLYFTVTDVTTFKPVICAIHLMHFLMDEFTQLTPARYPTAANPSGENHLDRLLGIPDSFASIKTDINSVIQKVNSEDVRKWKLEIDTSINS